MEKATEVVRRFEGALTKRTKEPPLTCPRAHRNRSEKAALLRDDLGRIVTRRVGSYQRVGGFNLKFGEGEEKKQRRRRRYNELARSLCHCNATWTERVVATRATVYDVR